MFKIHKRKDSDREVFWHGIEVEDITFRTSSTNPSNSEEIQARSAFGRAVIVDQEQCDIQIYPFYDVLNANFGNNKSKGVSPVPGVVNLGVSVQDFIESISDKSPYHKLCKSYN